MLNHHHTVNRHEEKAGCHKNKVDRAIDSMESLEKAAGECRGQQEKGNQEETSLPDCVVAEPQPEYGAELFEQYQREYGRGQTVQAAGQTVK